MVDWVATGWVVRVSSPGGGDFFSTHFQTDSGAHPAIRIIGTASLFWGYSGWGVGLTAHPV